MGFRGIGIVEVDVATRDDESMIIRTPKLDRFRALAC